MEYLGFLLLAIPAVYFWYQKFGMTSFSRLKYTPNSIKQMPEFENLVDKCIEDAKKSAIDAGKWNPDWDVETKMACRRILSTYIVAKKMERKYPEEFEKAIDEVD